jgi:hypothetical protein
MRAPYRDRDELTFPTSSAEQIAGTILTPLARREIGAVSENIGPADPDATGCALSIDLNPHPNPLPQGEREFTAVAEKSNIRL